MCFFVPCMSRVRIASLEVEKNGLEGKCYRSQDTCLSMDSQRSKTDSYVCGLPGLDKTNVLLLPSNRRMEFIGSIVANRCGGDCLSVLANLLSGSILTSQGR